MLLSGIFRKLFKRKTKTIILDRDEVLSRYNYKDIQPDTDKSIFEVVHTVEMKDHVSLLSGRVKRGFFRTGDNVDICSPTEGVPKLGAIIINIKTALVDVNKINTGSEADFLIRTHEGAPEIRPGDRVYKKVTN